MRKLLDNIPSLCLKGGCLRLQGHDGECSKAPIEAWSFLSEKDKDKLGKAGYATPRGGAKGAYQNHVFRNSRVIIPLEKLAEIPDLSVYKDGYVLRVFPEQCFKAAGKLRDEFLKGGGKVIGENAFVLYRSWQTFDQLPPIKNWKIRYLINKDGKRVESRGKGISDRGHYVLRLPKIGGGKHIVKEERYEGPPQGIFAPEYCDGDTDFLCRSVLAWQIVHTADSPYLTTQASHLHAILNNMNLLDYAVYHRKGIMRKTFTSCPLCFKPISYPELHQMLKLEDEDGLVNAADQVIGTTRSTIVNLFHFHPMVYEQLEHVPENVAWGHATCNTKLGQRRCYTLDELLKINNKVAVLKGAEYQSFGWMSDDGEMIRSPNGAVWIQITRDADFSVYPFFKSA